MEIEDRADEIDAIFCSPGKTKKEALIEIARHVEALVLEARIEEHKKYFDWECCDCNPEGFAEHHISLLQAELERE